jgi:aldehyde:ferredoxin oxidoreductase
MVPYTGDPFMLDYSDENIYSEHMAKAVAWDRHYSLFWKDSCLMCDWAWPDIVNPYGPNNRGMTPEAEEKFFKAVTGVDITFAESMEIGRKIWNLDNAIWVLQGRHRNMVHFMEYIYETPYPDKRPYLWDSVFPHLKGYVMPVYENGEWKFKDVSGRKLDKAKVEEWKTKFYKLEGWDPNTGWPTRKTLENLGLKHVADLLEAKGKLGKNH